MKPELGGTEEEWRTKLLLLGVTIEHNITGARNHKYFVKCKSAKHGFGRKVWGTTIRRCALNFLNELKCGRVTI